MKRTFLISYMLVCITLIVLILANGLAGPDGVDTPSYYRGPVDSSTAVPGNPTAATPQPENSIPATPSPTSHVEGGGSGIHRTETAEVYAITLTAIPTIED